MIYFFLIFACIISSVSKQEQVNNKVYQYTLLFIIIFIISTGYMCGTDWRNYELIYKEIGLDNNIWENYLYLEPLYVLTNLIFSKLNIDFWIFFISIKIFIATILIKTLKQICPKDLFYLSLLLFLSFFGFFMLVDNPMRNVIAVSITLIALPYLYKGKTLYYFLIVFIAILFHYSAIIMLLIFPIIKYRINNKIWLIVYILVNIIFIKPDLLFHIADVILQPFPFISWKVDSYLSQLDTVASGKVFSLGLIVHFIFFIMILKSRKTIEAIPNGKYIFNMSILFPILFRMGLTSLVFSRFQLYVSLFYVVSICCTCYTFTLKSRFLYKIYVITICTYSCYSIITADYRYIPYTNYFAEKIFGREMTYYERSNYNKIHSPYKNKTILNK